MSCRYSSENHGAASLLVTPDIVGGSTNSSPSRRKSSSRFVSRKSRTTLLEEEANTIIDEFLLPGTQSTSSTNSGGSSSSTEQQHPSAPLTDREHFGTPTPEGEEDDHENFLNKNVERNSNVIEDSSRKMKRKSKKHRKGKKKDFFSEIRNDFSGNGDFKIARAIGRTAFVNASITVGGPALGAVTGAGITVKRFAEGAAESNEREMTKSISVYAGATSASAIGQGIAGTVAMGVFHASFPVAAAVAFGVGCCSGITAGSLSEWGIDALFDDRDGINHNTRERRDSRSIESV